MKPQRVWAIRRSRREDACQRNAPVAARVNLEHVTARLVQPCHDDDLVANDDPVEPFGQGRTYLEPRVGRALATLSRRLRASLEGRVDDPDLPQKRMCFERRSSFRHDPSRVPKLLRPSLVTFATVRPSFFYDGVTTGQWSAGVLEGCGGSRNRRSSTESRDSCWLRADDCSEQ